jgi:type IV secretion system protein VirB9
VCYVEYQADEVTLITVQRGVATRIILGADEQILKDGAGTGFSADCSKPEFEWCMRAAAGANQILVRPKDNATFNNLELRTDKRDYSFRFEIVGQTTRRGDPAGGKAAATPQYRVTFRYPAARRPTAPDHPNAAALPKPTAADIIKATRPQPRNWQYSMQVLPGAEDIVPAIVFDDGRFTYFQFPANREVPTIYAISPSGEEARVNFHVDEHDAGMLVVERMGRRFVLRLGKAVVGIWNEAYDSYGIAPRDGTTVEGVVRTLR